MSDYLLFFLKLTPIVLPTLLYIKFHLSDPYKEFYLPKEKLKVYYLLTTFLGCLYLSLIFSIENINHSLRLLYIIITVLCFLFMLASFYLSKQERNERKTRKKEFFDLLLLYCGFLLLLCGFRINQYYPGKIYIYISFELFKSFLVTLFIFYGWNSLFNSGGETTKFKTKKPTKKPHNKLYFFRTLGKNIYLMGNRRDWNKCTIKYLYFTNTDTYLEIIENTENTENTEKSKQKKELKDSETKKDKNKFGIFILYIILAILPILFILYNLYNSTDDIKNLRESYRYNITQEDFILSESELKNIKKPFLSVNISNCTVNSFIESVAPLTEDEATFKVKNKIHLDLFGTPFYVKGYIKEFENKNNNLVLGNISKFDGDYYYKDYNLEINFKSTNRENYLTKKLVEFKAFKPDNSNQEPQYREIKDITNLTPVKALVFYSQSDNKGYTLHLYDIYKSEDIPDLDSEKDLLEILKLRDDSN